MRSFACLDIEVIDRVCGQLGLIVPLAVSVLDLQAVSFSFELGLKAFINLSRAFLKLPTVLFCQILALLPLVLNVLQVFSGRSADLIVHGCVYMEADLAISELVDVWHDPTHLGVVIVYAGSLVRFRIALVVAGGE